MNGSDLRPFTFHRPICTPRISVDLLYRPICKPWANVALLYTARVNPFMMYEKLLTGESETPCTSSTTVVEQLKFSPRNCMLFKVQKLAFNPLIYTGALSKGFSIYARTLSGSSPTKPLFIVIKNIASAIGFPSTEIPFTIKGPASRPLPFRFLV